MPSHVQTLQQQRAAIAWEQIEEITNSSNETFRKNYGSLVRSLPSMIQQNGLAPTLAFLGAKAGSEPRSPHAVAARHIAEGVREPLELDDNRQLLEWLLDQSSAVYRRATSESQAHLQWLKRFVEAKDWKSDGD